MSSNVIGKWNWSEFPEYYFEFSSDGCFLSNFLPGQGSGDFTGSYLYADIPGENMSIFIDQFSSRLNLNAEISGRSLVLTHPNDRTPICFNKTH